MKIPIVKEYGSWAVFIFSCIAGVMTGMLTRPWLTGKDRKRLFGSYGFHHSGISTPHQCKKSPLTCAQGSGWQEGTSLLVYFLRCYRIYSPDTVL
jgi:hypothetical protein